MTPTTIDRELEIRHNKDMDLECLLGKHVDDIKLTGPELIVMEVVRGIEAVFGKLTFNKNQFTNTGVRHNRIPNGTIIIDQDEYITALKPINHHSMTGAKGEDDVTPPLKELFWSLLGALAFTLLTQHWIAVYVVSLQRRTQSPQYIHVRRLNALVRILQRSPAKITYTNMTCDRHIEVHSDSGFSKEQESGYGIRGANFMRRGTTTDGKKVWHLLDSPCRSHKHVTRCSFSAETRAAVCAADELMPLSTTLQEFIEGPLTPTMARTLRDEGGYKFTTILVTDSMSLFAAVSATNIKQPTEKGLHVHLLWLRELLDKGIITTLRWADTRDMTADAHTKGCIDRKAILELMAGWFNYGHEFKDFNPYRPKAKYDAVTRPTHHPYAHACKDETQDEPVSIDLTLAMLIIGHEPTSVMPVTGSGDSNLSNENSIVDHRIISAEGAGNDVDHNSYLQKVTDTTAMIKSEITQEETAQNKNDGAVAASSNSRNQEERLPASFNGADVQASNITDPTAAKATANSTVTIKQEEEPQGGDREVKVEACRTVEHEEADYGDDPEEDAEYESAKEEVAEDEPAPKTDPSQNKKGLIVHIEPLGRIRNPFEEQAHPELYAQLHTSRKRGSRAGKKVKEKQHRQSQKYVQPKTEKTPAPQTTPASTSSSSSGIKRPVALTYGPKAKRSKVAAQEPMTVAETPTVTPGSIGAPIGMRQPTRKLSAQETFQKYLASDECKQRRQDFASRINKAVSPKTDAEASRTTRTRNTPAARTTSQWNTSSWSSCERRW